MGKIKAETHLNIDKPEEPYVDPGEEVIKTQNDLATDWGFTQDTIKHLYDDLNISINSDEPFFIWSKKRQNEKMKLNNEKLVLIYNQIKNLQEIAIEFLNLKAQAIFSSEYLKNLVEEKYMLAQQYFERKREEHLTIIKEEQAKRKHIDHGLTEREIAQRKAEAEIRKLNGEAAQAEAIADEINAGVNNINTKTKMLDKIIDTFDPSTLDPEQRTQIYVGAIMPGVDLPDPKFQNKMKENVYETEKAKLEMLQQQVEEQKIKVADLNSKKERNDRNRKKL